MTYSCTDFTDSILDALHINDLTDEELDSPSDQADYALNEIERLQRFEQQVRHALLVLQDTNDAERFVARVRQVAIDNAPEVEITGMMEG